MSKIIRTQVRLPESVYSIICEEVASTGESMNSIIVDALRQRIAKASTPTKVDDALALIANALKGINNEHCTKQ
jgi:hypothetical protein